MTVLCNCHKIVNKYRSSAGFERKAFELSSSTFQRRKTFIEFCNWESENLPNYTARSFYVKD